MTIVCRSKKDAEQNWAVFLQIPDRTAGIAANCDAGEQITVLIMAGDIHFLFLFQL